MVSLDFKYLYTISEVEEWLDQNHLNYDNILENWKCDKCPTQLGLPCLCNEPDPEWIFIDVYREFSKVIEFYKYESIAKQEISQYFKIKDNITNIKNWGIKNEKFATDVLLMFEEVYLNYTVDNDEEIFHLLVYNRRNQNIEIFVDRNNFSNLLVFIKLLYYVQKICPELVFKSEFEMIKRIATDYSITFYN